MRLSASTRRRRLARQPRLMGLVRACGNMSAASANTVSGIEPRAADGGMVAISVAAAVGAITPSGRPGRPCGSVPGRSVIAAGGHFQVA